MYGFGVIVAAVALVIGYLHYTGAIQPQPATPSSQICREGFAPARGSYGTICVPGYTP